MSIPLGNTFPNVRAEGDAAKIPQQDRRAVFAAYGDQLKVVWGLQVAEAANHILRAAQVEDSATDCIRAGLYPVDDHRQRDVVCQQLVRVEPNLILPYIAADARNLRDAGNRLQRVQRRLPVLKTAKVGEAMLAALIDKGILKDPTRAGGVRPDGWMNVGGEAASDLLEIFDDPGARPILVQVPSFKDDV